MAACLTSKIDRILDMQRMEWLLVWFPSMVRKGIWRKLVELCGTASYCLKGNKCRYRGVEEAHDKCPGRQHRLLIQNQAEQM